jgi:hypothetical protein
MPTPSGQISLSNVNTEIGRSSNLQIDLNDSVVRNLASKASGSISLNDLRNKTITITSSGLVMHLDAANSSSYPGTGTTWTDLSGNGNNANIVTGEFVDIGGVKYLRNAGNTSNFFYISVPNTTSINNTLSVSTGGWTIEEIIWTNSVDYPEADAGGVGSDNAYSAGGNTGFDWNHGIGNTQFQFGQSNAATGSYQDVGSFSLSSPYSNLNAWKHRTMIWNRGANTVALYINGVYQGGISTPNTAGKSVYDGGGINFGTLYGWKHHGRRALIRLYNRVLSVGELQQNFGATRLRYSL